MKPKNKKSALLCDASFSAIPLLEALKEKGLFVAVCGSRSGDPCHALADASFDIDYSNKKKLLKLVADNHFDYLVPGCTDVSYISCAWVADQLGLPGYDDERAVRAINHKDQYRELGKTMGYPIPAYETSIDNFKNVSFPALLKPTSSFSGRGIIKFDKYSSLRSFIDRDEFLALDGNVLLEEFAKGNLYSHSAFLKSGEIITDFFVNEYCTV
jgi:formate-dependent phosphoribosylglycinamide formyltransferase (GAR transformylase)